MLSVLIVNWNTRDKLEACLTSLFKHLPSLETEVIVVDNASFDGSAALVREHFPLVRLIEPGWNTGYAKGNNLAFESARGDLLLTLNPDTVFSSDALQTAVDSIRSRRDAGCLGIRLVGPDGSTQNSVRGFPTPLGVFGQLTKLDRAFPLSGFAAWSLPRFDYEESQWAPQPMGTFLLFKREALYAVGDPKSPFDEDFPIFFNEVDLLKRLNDKGWKCWYEAEASILHHHGSSTKQVKKSMVWESHNSLRRYWVKHLRGWQRLLLPLIAFVLFLAAFLRARCFIGKPMISRDNAGSLRS